MVGTEHKDPPQKTLRRAFGRSRLSPEEIEMVLCEVEAAVNSRPLTPLAGDAEELSPLPPAHFLIGRRTTHLPLRLGLHEPTSAELPPRAREVLRDEPVERATGCRVPSYVAIRYTHDFYTTHF